MDFRESAEDAAFRLEVRAWLQANVPPAPEQETPPPPFSKLGHDGDVKEARLLQRRLAEAGLAGITWPHAFGGRGGTASQQAIFAEESEGFDLPTSVFVIGIGLVGPTIIAHGTDTQRARYLPPILCGDEVWCQLFSEPDAGSDLASLRTRAVSDGGDWLITGEKVWSSGAHYSDWGILLARTDPAAPKHKGITYFLVDMRTAGITVHPLRQMTGDVHFNSVVLDQVRVPGDAVLGRVNDGWAVTMSTLMNERMVIAGGEVSVDFRQVLELARRSTVDGGPACDAPTVRQVLADLYARSQIMRFLRYRTLTALEQGRPPGPEASIGKLAQAQVLRTACDVVLRLEGPAATLRGDAAPARGSWQDLFLAAPALRIAGGTDEIQRNIIGERVLGLPREATAP